MRLRARPILFGALAILLLVPIGCRKAEVRIYDAPKNSGTPLNGPLSAASPNTGNVVWQKADHWQELPPTAFRKGNYLYTAESGSTVEITVSSFPGSTGGLLANVNRWLGQAGLPPVSQEQLIELVDKRQLTSEIEASVVDLNAEADDPNATRIYAAIVEYGGQTWFFKMTGPSADVFSQVEAFDEMVETLQFDPTPTSATSGAVGSLSDSLTFTAPEGWAQSEGSSMRIASYQIEKEGLPPADFAITSFPGDTGGLVANVNRWRRQIGLPAWSAAEVERATRLLTNEGGYEFRIFDLKAVGGDQSGGSDERILVAILDHNGKSWFFKLRGDPLLLETQRNKFNALLQSVDFTASKP